jgi:hypothetical protein
MLGFGFGFGAGVVVGVWTGVVVGVWAAVVGEPPDDPLEFLFDDPPAAAAMITISTTRARMTVRILWRANQFLFGPTA